MNTRTGLLLFFSLVFLACSEDKRPFFRSGKVDPKPFVLEMQHFFSEAEDNVSFPVWFDEALIKKNRIKTITRKVYGLNEELANVSSQKWERLYQFDQNGHLVSLQIKEFYEGQKVNDVTFHYSGVKDQYGFQTVTNDGGGEEMSDFGGYQMYHVEKTASNFLAYRNDENGNYLFFLPNEQHWGSLSVDSILGPTPEDIVIYGTPKVPVKRFNVENRVNESNVRDFVYAGKSAHPIKIEFDKVPFHYKRTINYTKSGECTGFVDSTFSLDQYLMRRNTRFIKNKQQLPVKVVHASARLKSDPNNTQIETFEYTYYE